MALWIKSIGRTFPPGVRIHQVSISFNDGSQGRNLPSSLKVIVPVAEIISSVDKLRKSPSDPKSSHVESWNLENFDVNRLDYGNACPRFVFVEGSEQRFEKYFEES